MNKTQPQNKSQVQKRIKKSKEAQQLQKSVSHTIQLFQKEAERAVYLTIPLEIQNLQELQSLPYIQPSFETSYLKQLTDLQPLDSPQINDKTLQSPLLLFPSLEFLQAEEAFGNKVNDLYQLIGIIRRSVETLQWKKKSVIQQETQALIIQQLKVSESNLQQVSALFVSYHDTRSDIVYSIQKHKITDYYIVLLTMERKLCRALRDFLTDFRIHLSMLYEILDINFDRISGEQKQSIVDNMM
ncbi:Proteasome activator pa28 beta subunit [Spironucleus salmonicida]|uniref:Proteasome activator pa28 beta subunit n=1 Tax=Spironucleus salmonicida TaxID=348837 RepID=V6M7G8_9EUKA|nr:Proteasome activator pa28 beta subunit [Spironucleus salmonicida]|eukprot:EST49389.1 Proteasome activator pa28 beta subunit [Spironucleus salmonicida]